MKTRLKSAVTGTAVLAVAGALLIGTGGAALAAAPPYEPDPSSIGGLTFYNAAGQQITGGNITDAPFAAYVQAGAAGRAGDTKATLFGYLPKEGVAIGSWSGEALTASTVYPNSSAPAPLNSSSLPLVSVASTDETIATLAADLPNTATDAYAGLYQLRLKTSGPGQAAGATYDSADIQITGNTWTVVYPAVTAATTTTTLTPSPSSPQQAGTSVTLNATVSPAAAGTVQFNDGGTALGTPVTVTGGSASTSTSSLSAGTHSLTAVFTPSNPLLFSSSTSAAVSYVISATPAQGTTTALSVNPTTAPAFTAVALHADVDNTAATPAALAAGSGQVEFLDGTTSLGESPLTATGADLSVSTFAVGTHPITAQFVPTDSTVYAPSTSESVTFTATTPQNAPALSTIEAEVAPGSLTITTPYGPTNPLNLGPLHLDPGGNILTATGAFGDASNPSNGVTITDTRAGDLPWTASVTTTDFADGGSGVINGQNLGFTSVTPSYESGDALNAATDPVVTNDIPTTSGTVYGPTDPGSTGLKGGPHAFATAAHGDGAVYIIGVLDLQAPPSTPSGTYTATLTFTIG